MNIMCIQRGVYPLARIRTRNSLRVFSYLLQGNNSTGCLRCYGANSTLCCNQLSTLDKTLLEISKTNGLNTKIMDTGNGNCTGIANKFQKGFNRNALGVTSSCSQDVGIGLDKLGERRSNTVFEQEVTGRRTFHITSTVNKTDTLKRLLHPVQKKTEETDQKVTMVGVGQVGMAAVFSMLTQTVTNNIAMVDMEANRLKAEMMDLQHGSAFMRNAKIQASTDYSITAGSRVCVVTAGVRQREGESRLALVQRNTDVMKIIIPKLLKYSPDTILILASNPVDIMTYVTWKISGLPKYRVIGSGTNLDSARFRYLLSEKLGIATTSCHGHIIGEHGDTSVPVWSGVNIGGVRLCDLNKKIGEDGDSENWKKIHDMVVQSAYEVIKLKGYTSWAIGLSLAQLTNAIVNNINSVHPVSTYIKGEHGIEEEVFLSLPCVLSQCGVSDVIQQTLTKTELSKLRKSAQAMAKVQKGIKF